MNLREELQQVQDKLAQLDPNNRDNLVEIARLKTRESELAGLIAKEETEQVIIQQQEQRIAEATNEVADIIDNMVIEGIPVRTLFKGEQEYQLFKIGGQPQLTSLAERLILQMSEMEQKHKAELAAAEDREQQLQRQNESLQEKLQEAQEREFKLTLDVQDLSSKRDAAVAEKEEALKEVGRLNGQVDDLRKEIAVGARNAYKVVDSEEQRKQLKEIAEQIKASRIPIYDKLALDFQESRYKAKLAKTGEEIEFGYLELGKYVEIKDEKEVLQFRQQHEAERVVQDTPLDQSVQDSVKEESFPAPALPAVYAPVVPGLQGEPPTGTVVPKTLEQRVAELEKHVFGWTNGEVA